MWCQHTPGARRSKLCASTRASCKEKLITCNTKTELHGEDSWVTQDCPSSVVLQALLLNETHNSYSLMINIEDFWSLKTYITSQYFPIVVSYVIKIPIHQLILDKRHSSSLCQTQHKSIFCNKWANQNGLPRSEDDLALPRMHSELAFSCS